MIKKITRFLNDNEGSAVKAGIYYLVCQLVVKGLAFLASPIFTRIMTKSEFGMVSNFMAWEGILFPILTLNLRVSINKSRYDFADDNNSFLASILLCAQAVVSVLLLGSFVVKDFFEAILSMEITYVRLLLLYILFYTAFDFQQIQYNIFKKYKLYVLYSIISSVFSLALSVILVLYLDDRTLGRLLGIVVPMIIVCSVIEINIIRRLKKVRLKYIKYALTMSIPLLLSPLASALLSSSDRVIIAEYCSMEEVAMYSVAYTIAGIAAIVMTAFSQAWAPWLLDHLNTKEFEEIKYTAKKVSLVFVILVLGLMLLSPEILFIMGGEPYMGAIIAMPPVILAMVCNYYYAFYFDVEYFYGETYIISLGTLLAALVNIGLNLIFIPMYGYVAAAYTTLIGYVVMLLYHYLIVKYKLKKGYIFDNRFNFMLIVFCIIAQCVISLIYSDTVARYFIIMCYLLILSGVLYKHRQMVMTIRRRIFK